jgi:hypothetical protein
MNTILEQLEKVFTKYKFTSEQKQKATFDLFKVGETMVLARAVDVMTPEQKSKLESLVSFQNDIKENLDQTFNFLNETCGEEKMKELRDSVYNKLLGEYISQMSQ